MVTVATVVVMVATMMDSVSVEVDSVSVEVDSVLVAMDSALAAVVATVLFGSMSWVDRQNMRRNGARKSPTKRSLPSNRLNKAAETYEFVSLIWPSP